MQGTDPNSLMDLLKTRLANHYAFFHSPFSFIWWQRGGEPGSPSDSLTLENAQNEAHEIKEIKATYNRGRFDPKERPPVKVEKFVGTLPVSEVQNLLGVLFDSPVFRSHSEGENPDIRDVRKETWGFRNADANVTRTFPEPFPPEFDPIRELCQKLANELAAQHKG